MSVLEILNKTFIKHDICIVCFRHLPTEDHCKRCGFAEAIAELEKMCEWTPADGGYCAGWETGCGRIFITDGNPKQMKMPFCPYCGHEIKDVQE